MQNKEKFLIQRKTRLKYQFMRFKTGLQDIIFDRKKTLIAVGYFVLVFLLWMVKGKIFYMNETDIFGVFNKIFIELLFPVHAVVGFVVLLVLIGTPFGAKNINENLWRTGLINHAGEAPLLLRKKEDKENNITTMEFASNGIPRCEWEDKQDKLEASLNVHIIEFSQGKSKNRVILRTVSGDVKLPKFMYWQENFLSSEDFTLVLGKSVTERVTVNLAKIPHVLLGGSTGSGKSVLLKLLIMQSIKKDADVYIADFKGGVDFPKLWHSKCNIITDEKTLLELLTKLVEELENRKKLLRSSGCANIGEYNLSNTGKLKRIIFTCDEIAEVLDKTGLTKEAKETVLKIENKLSVIARQGRAFGIHLILATQRPDANILTGQIRNNIDFRVCGRADNVLSQIILDNTKAADEIPKNAQGLFITHDGKIFQGYLFDEKTAFAE